MVTKLYRADMGRSKEIDFDLNRDAFLSVSLPLINRFYFITPSPSVYLPALVVVKLVNTFVGRSEED